MIKFEKKILDFCKKNYVIIFGIIITLMALVVRVCMLKFESNDYRYFLSPWFDYLKSNGGLKALANYPGDYNAPYVTILSLLTYLPFNKIYLIKGFSVVFDFVLAVSSAFLASKLVTKEKKSVFVLTYCILLFLPNMLMNSALWGQCDSVYTSFVVISLIYLIDHKYLKSFVFLGIAFAFKLQFIFILPLYVIYYVVKEKFSILHFLIIPFVNFIMCIPCILMGKPILDCFLVYFKQTSTFKEHLVMNFPNIYNLIGTGGDVGIFYRIGELSTVFVLALLLFYFIKNKIKLNKEKILLLGIYSTVITTFLLPGMHERYLFMAEILSVLYFIVYRRNILLPLFINFASVITYSNFLNQLKFPYMSLLSIGYLIVIFLFTKNFFDIMEEKNANEAV